MHTSERQTRMRRVMLAAIMGATLGFAAHTLARDDSVDGDSRKITCADGQATMVERTCPPTARRPAVVVQRACCTKSAGGVLKTRCKSFPHCPCNSPS